MRTLRTMASSYRTDVKTYSDASDVACGGYALKPGGQTAVGSSSEAEFRAARLVLQSVAPQLEGMEVRRRKDNQNAKRIMTI